MRLVQMAVKSVKLLFECCKVIMFLLCQVVMIVKREGSRLALSKGSA